MDATRKSIRDSNLIFLHIPKNGGTTLHRVIERKFPKEAIYTVREIEGKRSNIPEFIALPEEARARIRVIKGHLQFGTHKHLVGPSKYITFLRKPEDRVLSYYHYVRKRPDHRMYREASDRSLYEFVRDFDHNDIHNTQVQWISGMMGGDPDTMFEQAMKNIENHFSFVGFLEHYDTSLILLSRIYGWGVPWYRHKNRGSYKKSKQLDSETAELIAKKNAADIRLYEALESQFLEKVGKDRLLKWHLKRLHWINGIRASDTLKRLRKL